MALETILVYFWRIALLGVEPQELAATVLALVIFLASTVAILGDLGEFMFWAFQTFIVQRPDDRS